MAVPTLIELYTPLTDDQVLGSFLAFAAQLGLPVTAWEPGSVGREMFEIYATQLAAQTDEGQVAAAGGLLDYSSGDWLTLCADQVFDVQRLDATFAAGTLRLFNNSGIAVVLAPGDVRAYDAGLVPGSDPSLPQSQIPILSGGAGRLGGTGKTYTSTTGGTIAPGGSLDVTVSADEAGSASTAQPGAISALATPISGVYCSNPLLIAADDGESDPALRARCRESMARASPNGPSDSYRFFSTSALLPDGSSAGCTKVLVVQQDGSILLYCAGDSGPLAGTVGDAASPLGAVDASVRASSIPTGLGETTLSAVGVPVVIAMTVWLSQGATVSDAEALASVSAGLAALFVALPVGGYNVPGFGRGLFVNNVETAVFDSLPGQVVQVQLSSPSGTVTLTQDEVATLASLTVTFVRLQQ